MAREATPFSERSIWLTCRLADLNQVPVRIADVRPNFTAVVLRLCEKLRTFRGPVSINLGHIRDSHVEKCARSVGVWRCGQRNGRLVISGPTPDVENQPRIRDLHDDRVAFEHYLCVEERLVELARAILVGNNQKVRQDEAFTWRWELVWAHAVAQLLLARRHSNAGLRSVAVLTVRRQPVATSRAATFT